MNNPQEVTLTELIMVKNCIIYPVILDVLERDIGKMKLMDLKIPFVYIGNLKHVQAQITRELIDIKRELRKHGIRIIAQSRSVNGIKAEYICRGYQHQLSFLPSVIRSCVTIKVCVLLKLDITNGGRL